MSGVQRTPVAKTVKEGGENSTLTQTAGTVLETQTQPPPQKVRKSISHWEPKNEEPFFSITPPEQGKTAAPTTTRAKPTGAILKMLDTPLSPTKTEGPKTVLAEAKILLIKAKTSLKNSGNLKREIRNSVTEALERMYEIIKDYQPATTSKLPTLSTRQETKELLKEVNKESQDIDKTIQRHMQLIKEHNEQMQKMAEEANKKAKEAEENRKELEEIRKEVTKIRKITEETEKGVCALKDQAEQKTYASAAATPTPFRKFPEHTALHSLLVTTKEGTETGDQILNRIRTVVNAKEGGVQVDRVRKAKDRKVIVGCKTAEDRDKIKEKLKEAEELNVEEVQNKDPLIVLKDVLQHNAEEDITTAIRNQNKTLFLGISAEDDRINVAYKKRARNPHTCSVVIRVSPALWQRFVRAEAIHIDLQRVRVADQSPLVQCSTCLGYGHGKRLCKETLPKCSHCAGPHMRGECPDWMAGTPPTCCNCQRTKQDRADHNAFSSECPVRRRWDALARASVAYC